MNYESRHEPILPRALFIRRMLAHFLVSTAFIVASLLVGMWGYHHFESLAWLDAFLDSSMLLGGMGPVHTPTTAGGKTFAGLYALYCGLVILAVMGILLAPILHRVLHKFHWETED